MNATEKPPQKTHFDLLRIWRAFFHSMRGLKMAFFTEPAFFQNTLFVAALVTGNALDGRREAHAKPNRA